MEATTYTQIKLNSINTLTVEIEEAFNNNFSIIAYDTEGGVWVEKFANTYSSAKIVAEKLVKSIIKLY